MCVELENDGNGVGEREERAGEQETRDNGVHPIYLI
jgi:hypothetical protein